MLVKFEQSCMVQTTRNELFERVFLLAIFDAILEDVSVAEEIMLNTKVLIWRLPSFSVSKLTVVQIVQPD